MSDAPAFRALNDRTHDFVELEALARCALQRQSLPELFSINRARVSPVASLETLLNVRRPCPAEVPQHIMFADPGATVATVAEGLLTRFRRTGQLPQAASTAPMQVRARDDADGLSQLARIYRAERKPPAVVTVRGVETSTTSFVAGLSHDRSPCPTGAASDIGLPFNRCTMAEGGVSLIGRLRQAGALA